MTKTRYWRCESLVVDLPKHPNSAGGTWKYHPDDASLVFVTCPCCCKNTYVKATAEITTTNEVYFKCKCGFFKLCRLTDYGK